MSNCKKKELVRVKKYEIYLEDVERRLPEFNETILQEKYMIKCILTKLESILSQELILKS